MNKRLLLFNVIFYTITLILYYRGIQDPSCSLGYGFFILFFWVAALLLLVILLIRKIIPPKNFFDTIGIITATPAPCIIAVILLASFKDTLTSERYFTKGHCYYKEIIFEYNATGKTKRIEYYKIWDTTENDKPFANVDKWVKDSTWIYFSESGDTANIVKYKDDIQVK